MLKSFILALFILVISAGGAFCQVSWATYEIENLGKIKIPNTLELQGGKVKEVIKELYKIYGINQSDVIFQQAGFNELDEESKKTYARVMIKTNLNSEAANSPTDKIEISKRELEEYDEYIRQQLEATFESIDVKLIDWYSLEIKKIGNYYAYYYSYTRRLKSNPKVFVEIYTFENEYKLHTITMSYRVEDEDIWKEDFETIINSLTF